MACTHAEFLGHTNYSVKTRVWANPRWAVCRGKLGLENTAKHGIHFIELCSLPPVP